MYKKDKRKYTTIYIPGGMLEIYNTCNEILRKCDCNLSQIVGILVPLIVKICSIIYSMNKNHRHFRFEIIAKDHGTDQWISSDDTIHIGPRIS